MVCSRVDLPDVSWAVPPSCAEATPTGTAAKIASSSASAFRPPWFVLRTYPCKVHRKRTATSVRSVNNTIDLTFVLLDGDTPIGQAVRELR